MKYLAILRPINLLIIVVTQWLFVDALLFPDIPLKQLAKNHLTLFALTSLVTILITSSGYVINDYFDFETDQINKKYKPKFKQDLLMRYYLLVVLVGALISICIAIQYDLLPYLALYPISILVLFFYSKKLQKISTLGNVMVATMSAGGMAILLFADLLFNPRNLSLSPLIFLFVSFAFLVSWIREIVKDMEDMEGDQASGYRTLVLQMGTEKTKAVVLFLMLILILVECFCAAWLYTYCQVWSLAFAILLLPHIFYLLSLSLKISNKKNYSQLSTMLKIHMGLGLVFLFVIKYLFTC